MMEKDQLKRLFALILVAILIGNLLLFSFRVINIASFWSIIIIAAAISYIWFKKR